MEGKKISQLIPDTSPSTDDFIVTVDGTTLQNKRVDLGNLPVSNPTNALFDSKVDKAPGKQLSDQNYTQGEKNKLAGIEAGAEVNEVSQADLVHDHDTRYANQARGVMAKTKSASLPSSYGYLGQKFTNGVDENDLVIYGESTQAGTPTPDVPVPIVSTTGNVTVKSVDGTGNLFDKTDSIITGKLFNVDGTLSDIEGVYIQATYIPVAPSTQYTMSYPSSGAMRPVQYDANKNFIVRSNATAQTHTFMTASNAAFVRISGVTHFIDSTQFEKGTGTPYKAFRGSTQTLPLGTTQLRSLPNGVSDRIYKSGSSWYLEQNVGSKLLNGVESYFTSGTLATVSRYGTTISGADSAIANSATVSTHFPGVNSYGLDSEHSYIPGDGLAIFLFVNTSRASTVTALRAFLAANPVTVIYQLLTPIATTITDPAQIAALENIRTYQGITNITASTPVSGSYGLDMTATLNGKVSKAGDTMTGRLVMPSTEINGVLYLSGLGYPNGVVSAPVGSIYIDKNITNGASSWIKKSGTGTTGWQVLEGDTGWRNIGSLLVNGWTGSLYIKRTASGLSIHVEGISSSAATSGSVAILPSGFAPSTVSGVSLNRNFVSTATGPASMYRVTINSGGAVVVQNFSTSMGTMYGTMYMSTADAYPTTLPGTPA